MILVEAFHTLKQAECRVLIALLAYRKITKEELPEITGIPAKRLAKVLVTLLQWKLIERVRVEHSESEVYSLAKAVLDQALAQGLGDTVTTVTGSPSDLFRDHYKNKNTYNKYRNPLRAREASSSSPQIKSISSRINSRAMQAIADCIDAYSEEQDKLPESFSKEGLLGMFYSRLADHFDMDEARAIREFAPSYKRDADNLHTLLQLFQVEGTWWAIDSAFTRNSLNWLDKKDLLSALGLKKLRTKVEMAIAEARKGKRSKGQEQSHWSMDNEASEEVSRDPKWMKVVRY